ncbi:hypothetical protein VTK56DRAFT_5411 [Thermocarpiscus australiensis]
MMSPREPEPGLKAVAKTETDRHNVFLALLPQIPLLLRVAILHILRVSQQSKYLDLRTELIVAVLRSLINPPHPRSITSTQKLLAHYPAIRGRIWISTYTCPPPPPGETGVRDAIAKAIDGMWDPRTPKAAYQMPEVAPVEAEWTGYRVNATSESRLPEVSQRELYAEMMADVKSPVTVLYFHGGAYWLLDPASHRATTKTLAKLTGGRVYSVRYRLAPQHPFPAALMDALVSYLALLYPPEGAFHEAVKPEHIVFAGDSAGGNLALALLQLILFLNRHNHHTTIPWLGAARPVPLPAGAAVNSPWMDVTHSSPSCIANAAFDYLPTPAQQRAAEARRPPCAAWPASPPRSHVYAADALLTHPLVTLLLAPSWRGAPPVYMCTGWELLADEDKCVAHRLWAEGVSVVFEEYEGMPHCFGLLFPHLKEARRCFEGWAGFMKVVAEGGREAVQSRFVTVRARTLYEVEIEPGRLWRDGEDVVAERVYRQVRARGVSEEGIAKL